MKSNVSQAKVLDSIKVGDYIIEKISYNQIYMPPVPRLRKIYTTYKLEETYAYRMKLAGYTKSSEYKVYRTTKTFLKALRQLNISSDLIRTFAELSEKTAHEYVWMYHIPMIP